MLYFNKDLLHEVVNLRQENTKNVSMFAKEPNFARIHYLLAFI
jgi:hypothetical protein